MLIGKCLVAMIKPAKFRIILKMTVIIEKKIFIKDNQMKKFNQFITKLASVLQALLIIAMGLLGILLIALLFRELIPIFQELFSHSIIASNEKILNEIIIFFLFFEFTAMIIAALRHHGHTSIEFLMGLGVTALVRGLITTHNNIEETFGIAIAILLLIISMAIFHRYSKNEL